MDKLQIIGKASLKGSINIPGAKNAALPLMVGSLLSKNGLHLKNMPALHDVFTMKRLLESFGIKINKIDSQIFLIQPISKTILLIMS